MIILFSVYCEPLPATHQGENCGNPGSLIDKASVGVAVGIGVSFTSTGTEVSVGNGG